VIKKLTKIGNSRALVIDKQTLAQMGVREGEEVQVSLHGQQLVITPVRPHIPDPDFHRSLNRIARKYDSVFRKLAE
jgi:antitoxin component of MazEF toxin-antitoxin module